MILKYENNRIEMNNKYNKQLGEVIRFGIVGVVATLMQYAIYWVLVLWLNPTLAMTIGYAISLHSTSLLLPDIHSVLRHQRNVGQDLH